MTLIKHPDRIKQGIDFSGLQNGKIYPTDIDAVMEFDNEFLILFEVKYKGKVLSGGQKLLLQRMCDNWQGKAIVLVVEHETPPNEFIQLHECTLRQYYKDQEWHRCKGENVKQVLSAIAEIWGIKKLCASY